MKRFLICLFVCLLATIAKADNYIAYATTNVNLRECASTDCAVLAKVPKHEILFVDTDDIVDGFYHVVFVDLDISGYIYYKYVQLYKKVEEQDGGLLPVYKETQEYNPQIHVSNDCDVKITLKVNDDTYTYAPHEKGNITVSPGKFKYRASSPGVIPCVGYYTVLSNNEYDWKFWIQTTRR